MVLKNNLTASPIIIGGASRNGKTMLAAIIGQCSDTYHGVPFELLLNVYDIWDRSAWNHSARVAMFNEYARHRRATSADRSESLAPIDYLNTAEISTLIDKVRKYRSSITWISRMLTQIARKNGKSSWVGADIHAECIYERLRQKIPRLRLIVAVRDPVEAACAGLYWRTFPDRIPRVEQELRFSASAWRLSAETGAHLNKKYPTEVLVLDMDRLWMSKKDTITQLANFLGVDAERLKEKSARKPWFSKTNDVKFLCPDGTARKLLSRAERQSITFIAKPIQRSRGKHQKVTLICRLARHWPNMALYLLALRRTPATRLSKSLYRLKRSLILLTARSADKRISKP